MPDIYGPTFRDAIGRLLERYPDRQYTLTHAPDTQWVQLDFAPRWGEEATEENGAQRFGIWPTGDIYRVGDQGAVDDEPFDSADERERAAISALQRRAHTRPLSMLTGDELHALNDLRDLAPLLRADMRERLSDLSFFAHRELAEREYLEEVGR